MQLKYPDYLFFRTLSTTATDAISALILINVLTISHNLSIANIMPIPYSGIFNMFKILPSKNIEDPGTGAVPIEQIIDIITIFI